MGASSDPDTTDGAGGLYARAIRPGFIQFYEEIVPKERIIGERSLNTDNLQSDRCII